VDALAGTDFHYLSMIKRICVYDDCLWVHLHKQLINAAEVNLWIKAELPAITIKQLSIRVSDAHNLDVRTTQIVGKEALYMPMYQSNDGNW
jgi:hypothetical protein